MEDLQEGDIFWPVRENNRPGLLLGINGAQSASDEFRVSANLAINGKYDSEEFRPVSPGLAINDAMYVAEELRISTNLAVNGTQFDSEEFRVSPGLAINGVMSVSEKNRVSPDLAINDAQSASEEFRVSAPINIPSRETTRKDFNLDSDEDHEDEERSNGAKSKIIPPHVIIARRFADQMFSVCFGNGRTLRGRDLFNFRNSIFRMTGFIE